jgi:hypothetical protein
MNKHLRKWHFLMWSLLAILIPLGIFTAWIVIPVPVKDQLFQPWKTLALPVIEKSFVRNSYIVRLRRSENDSDIQLEWENTSALVSPSAIIYEMNPHNKWEDRREGNLVGRISGRGIYHFPLEKIEAGRSYHFILYDIMHRQVIDRVNF